MRQLTDRAVESRRQVSRREFFGAATISVAALIVWGCGLGGCNRADPDAALLAPRQLMGGTDITFFVAADTHFGRQGIDKLNARQIAAMNTLVGTAMPAGIGGTVREPLGVLVAGDLTNGGRKSQWKQFTEYYGLAGGDGLLKYPVYEGTGNHDRMSFLLRPVISGVKKRHGSLTYSWDWGDVHLVCLDLYPNASNLRWLKRDLARVGRVVPVVLYFHYSILGPYSRWWSDREKEAFRQAIDGFNIIGIFHGHYHGSMHYKWQGYDVYNVGSPRHGRYSFAVVRVTDTTMTVASRNWNPGRWRWRHTKAINGRAGPAERFGGDR